MDAGDYLRCASSNLSKDDNRSGNILENAWNFPRQLWLLWTIESAYHTKGRIELILSGAKIESLVQTGEISIDPFDRSRLNPNSYDVRLGAKLLRYTNPTLDTRKNNPNEEILIPDSGMVLKRQTFYVGHIQEVIGSDYYVPILHGKLRLASLGLCIHVTANLVDIGNHCNFSLHLFPTQEIILKPEMVIAQVSFWKVKGPIKLYQGKYKGVKGPAASQSFKHF